MTRRLLAELSSVLEKWVEDNCEADDWPTTMTGEKTVDCMVEAAAAVFDACHEGQEFAQQNGFLKRA